MNQPDWQAVRSPGIVLSLALMVVLLLGWVDYLTGTEISFSIFYLVPVSLASWYAGIGAAIVTSLVSAASWYLAELLNDVQAGHVPSSAMIPVWNATMRLLIFMIVTVILARLRLALRREQNSRAEAIRAAQAKAAFLANMSHEIRTPLNAVIGIADLLAESPLSRTQQDWVRLFQREGLHLRRLVDDILDLSRLEAGKIRFERVPFRLRDLVSGTFASFAEMTKEKSLELTSEIDSEVPDVFRGDPHRLRQVLVNLVGNAIKFTERGFVRLRVTNEAIAEALRAEAGSSRTSLCFAIADSGKGIAPDDLATLFDRFAQADASIARRFGGSGLGLSIAQQLVQQMAGRLWAESVVGRGSTFYFTLPLERDAETPKPTPAAQPMQSTVRSGPPGVARHLRILLAEDVEITRKVFHAFLTQQDWQVEPAENGKIAVAKFQTGQYDAVVMDMQMPEMDGLEATHAIRAWEKANQRAPTPIIALTASAMPEEMERCFAAGCTRFLTKPIPKAELLRSIIEAVEPRSPSRDSSAHPPKTCAIRLDTELKPFVAAFMQEIREWNKTAQEALSRSDFTIIRSVAHKSVGASGAFGFSNLAELDGALEEAALKEDASEVARLLGEIETYLKQVTVTYEQSSH